MGFYLELEPDPGDREFREARPAFVYWALYAFAGLALVGMAAAAHRFLGDLLSQGNPFDWVLVGGILAVLPLYLALGVRLCLLRRYVSLGEGYVEVGFRVGPRPVWQRRLQRAEVARIALANISPAPNVAPHLHGDPQYYVRGHWRLQAVAHRGKPLNLDKHTEKEALEGLRRAASEWLGGVGDLG